VGKTRGNGRVRERRGNYPGIGIHRPAVIGSRARSSSSCSISDKDLLFKSNVLRKLLIRRDRRAANALQRLPILPRESLTPPRALPLPPPPSSVREFNEG